MSAPVVFVVFSKTEKVSPYFASCSHSAGGARAAAMHRRAPQTIHRNLLYMNEPNSKFCKNSWLEGQQCAECKKRFVLDKPGEGEFTPSGKTPLWFCQCCKIREVQRRGGNSGKVPGVIHCFCDSCYKPKLSECAKNTPRGKRSITAVQKNVDSSCLDPVRKELLPAE